MRFLVCMVWVLSFSAVSGQSGNNPFDIQGRKDSIYQPTPSIENNMFDIDRTSTNVSTPANTESNASASPIQNTPDSPNESKDQVEKIPSGNPFEVSHIPIRKSKLKQEADAFRPKRVKDEDGSQSVGNTFLFWLVLFSGLLIAIVINLKRQAILKISKAIFNENILKYNQREEQNGTSGFYLILYTVFFINAAIFIYLLFSRFEDKNGYKVFLWCLAGVIVAYLFKHLILRLLGMVFPITKESKLYSFTIETFNIFMGLVLVPLNLIIAFGPVAFSNFFLYLTLAILGVLFLLRVFRSLLISTTYIQNNIFHFFLYLCALEIIPVMLIIKLIL